jgi:hypothetical protein
MATLEDLIKLRLKQDKSNKGYVRLISDFRNEKWDINFIDNVLSLDRGVRNEAFPPDVVLQGEMSLVLLKTILDRDDFYIFTMKDPGLIETWVKEK